MISDDDPVTLWIEQLRAEDDEAAVGLWRYFARRLHNAARKKLRGTTRPLYDEKDTVLNAFNTVCMRIAKGQFQDLTDRNGLLGLLLVFTARKFARRHQFDQRDRRDSQR